MSTRVLILCNESRDRVDAIRDASGQLARALAAEGAVAVVCMRPDGGRWPEWPARRANGSKSAAEPWDVLLLQYNPFLYGRYGFAPWLVWNLARLRRRRRRPRIALMVHEPYVPMKGWRWTLMGLWQRLQLALLRASSDVVFVSIEVWTDRLDHQPPSRPTTHLPVGSNLPDRRCSRGEARRLLGAGDAELVVATLSSGHPSHDLDLVEAALRALAERGRECVFLALGAGARLPLGLPRGVRVERPGELSAEELADRLAAADIFMAPLIDGISTRRTTAMAALQHGLAVVATDGPLTDRVFREFPDAVGLVPVGEPALFAAEVVRLAEQPAIRASLAGAGERLYHLELDWRVSARRLLGACGGAR
jgi:glycosyltransferase involved in cell wall biosynthesis